MKIIISWYVIGDRPRSGAKGLKGRQVYPPKYGIAMARHHANYTARILVIGLTVLRIPDYIKFYILFAWYKKFSIVKNSVITPVPRRGRPVIEAKQKVNPLREALYANDLDCTKVHKARTKLFGMKLWFVRNYIKRDLNQSFRNLFWIYYSDLKKKYHPSKKKPTTAGAMCGGTIRLASCSPEGCEGFLESEVRAKRFRPQFKEGLDI